MNNQSEALSQLAITRKFVDAHDLVKGNEAADRVLTLDPSNIDAMIEKITLWYTSATADVVADEISKIHELMPGSAADLFAQAVACSDETPTNAVDLLDQALALDPCFDRAWFVKGHILFEIKEYEQAKEALDRALELAPHHSITQHRAGMAKHTLGDYWGAAMNLSDYMKTPNFCDRLLVYVTLSSCFVNLSEQEMRKEKERREQFSTSDMGVGNEEENSTTNELPALQIRDIISGNSTLLMAPFHRKICEMIDALDTKIPFDVALLNASMKEATIIDIDDSLRRIVNTDHEVKTLSFSDLVDAVPPIDSDNLFIQFRANSIHLDVTEPKWIGVHMVNLKIAGGSMVLNKYKLMPYELADFSHVYAMVFYEEGEPNPKIDQYGVVLGVREKEGSSHPGYFPLSDEKDPGEPGDLEVFLQYIFTMTYHMFGCFQLVNQGEAALNYKDGIYWI